MSNVQIMGNPYALIRDNQVAEVVFMHNYTDEEISAKLEEYAYDTAVSCSEYGAMLYVGYVQIDDLIIQPSPFPSWLLKKELGMWVPPVDRPDEINSYSWDEDNLSWKTCGTCDEKNHVHENTELHFTKEIINAN